MDRAESQIKQKAAAIFIPMQDGNRSGFVLSEGRQQTALDDFFSAENGVVFPQRYHFDHGMQQSLMQQP